MLSGENVAGVKQQINAVVQGAMVRTRGLVYYRVLGAKAYRFKVPGIEREFEFLNPPSVSVRMKNGRLFRVFPEWKGEILLYERGKLALRVLVEWKGHIKASSESLLYQKELILKENIKRLKAVIAVRKQYRTNISKHLRALKRLQQQLAEVRSAYQVNNNKRFGKLKITVYDKYGVELARSAVVAKAVHNRVVAFGSQMFYEEKGRLEGGVLVKEEWKPFGLRGYFNHVLRVGKVYRPRLSGAFENFWEAREAARQAFVKRPVRVSNIIERGRGVARVVVAPAGAHAAAVRIINRDHAWEGRDRIYAYLQQGVRLVMLHYL